jgi:hypothetical protein
MRNFNALLKEVVRMPELEMTINPHTGGVIAVMGNRRKQMIVTERQADRYVLTSVVIGRARVENMGTERLLPRIWLRNREISCVAFGLDKRGRLIGRIEQLADTLDKAELAFYIQLLARECDQFEYALTGQDVS